MRRGRAIDKPNPARLSWAHDPVPRHLPRQGRGRAAFMGVRSVTGRRELLDTVRAELAARQGVLLHGPAGIGKSTLLASLMASPATHARRPARCCTARRPRRRPDFRHQRRGARVGGVRRALQPAGRGGRQGQPRLRQPRPLHGGRHRLPRHHQRQQRRLLRRHRLGLHHRLGLVQRRDPGEQAARPTPRSEGRRSTTVARAGTTPGPRSSVLPVHPPGRPLARDVCTGETPAGTRNHEAVRPLLHRRRTGGGRSDEPSKTDGKRQGWRWNGSGPAGGSWSTRWPRPP